MSQRLTKYEQIHRTVCLFAPASLLVCVPKWRVSKHQNRQTHTKWFAFCNWGNRRTNSSQRKWPLTFANLSEASPRSGIIHTEIFFPSVFTGTSVLLVSKLETGLQLFSLQKHLSKQQQSQGQVSPVSLGDSSWQKIQQRQFLRRPLKRNNARVQDWPQLGRLTLHQVSVLSFVALQQTVTFNKT